MPTKHVDKHGALCFWVAPEGSYALTPSPSGYQLHNRPAWAPRSVGHHV